MATPNELLEAARMRKRWSVAVASEKAGVSVNTFNRWERGLQIPQLSTLDLLCKAFDMSPEELGFGHAITGKRRITEPLPPESAAIEAIETADRPFTVWIPPTTGASNSITPILQPIGELPVYPEQMKRSLEQMSQTQIKKGGNEVDRGDKGISRRQAITTLIGTPVTVFGLTQGIHPELLHPEEVLSLCTIGIPLLWRLYFEGGLAEVSQTLPAYLTQLTKLAQEPSPYQKRAASLASQGYQLASLLSLQYQNFGTSATYATQASQFADQIEDAHLLTAALIRQAQVYFYLKRPRQRLLVYERALHTSSKASPLLQGRVYIGLAETHSNLGKEQEASHYLDLAHKTFPANYEDDPNFSYTHFNCWSLSSFEGAMHLNLKRPQQAWKTLMQVDTLIPHGPVPDRLQLSVQQATASYMLDEMDQSCAYLEAAVRGALTAGNHLRYDEAYTVYECMQHKWGKEQKIKVIRQLFL